MREGRRPALRLLADNEQVTVHDEVTGAYAASVDDVVLRRNDGVAAYNLAVVVDDAEQSISEIVRGNDLLSSSPRHLLLQRLLGYDTPRYRHVPLAVNNQGQRLAKRDGAVTLTELADEGVNSAQVLERLAISLNLAAPREKIDLGLLVARFDIAKLPRDAWVVDTDLQRSGDEPSG